MCAPVWDDDNQPRFIEDDDGSDGNQGGSKPNTDQPDKAKNVTRPRDRRRSDRNDRERITARAAREQAAHNVDPQSSTNGVDHGDKTIPPRPNADGTTPTPSIMSSESPVMPSPADSPEELPASDIFMEIMKRAAATNASREERRREHEAKRSRAAADPATTPAKSVIPPQSELNSTPEPGKTDERPLWEQVRDYTPPTPLERALASLSSFATEGKIEPDRQSSEEERDTEESISAPPLEHSSVSDSVIERSDYEYVSDELTDETIDFEAAPPVPVPSTSRRPARPSLAESLAEVVIEDDIQVDETQEAASDRANVSIGEALPTQPLTDEERIAAAKLEAQKVRRIKKRQQQRRQRRVSVLGGVIRSFLVVIPSALLMATILSWWTDPQFLRPEMRHNIQSAIIAEGATPVPPTPFPTPNWARLIGIVSGHSGPGQTVAYDPGAVCEDLESLNEHDINMQTAIQVVRKLRERGYVVDLLDEFDPRLVNYQAAALVSIHANTCQDFGEVVSGYLVAKAEARPEGGIDTELAECIAKYYGNITRLERRFGLTEDMTDYHTFREIDVDTPAAIIELGFMRADRDILNNQPELMADGIVQGIMCFLEPQLDTLPDPTMTPTP
jgi:N-acetylmuramoyl-L-alanine amidase